MSRLVAYQVQEDGNWDSVTFKKENMKANEVFIFVNEERKEIWIWVGQEADVKSRFISSTVAQEIKRLYGLTFRIHAADQGDEPEEFRQAIIDSIPKKGIGPSEKKLPADGKAPTRAPTIKKGKTRTRKRTTTKKTKTAKKKTTPPRHPRQLVTESPNLPSNKKETPSSGQPSLITTPLCPECKKGHLLPYSTIVSVTSRRKDILPFGKWVCSNCKHTLELVG